MYTRGSYTLRLCARRTAGFLSRDESASRYAVKYTSSRFAYSSRAAAAAVTSAGSPSTLGGGVRNCARDASALAASSLAWRPSAPISIGSSLMARW